MRILLQRDIHHEVLRLQALRNIGMALCAEYAGLVGLMDINIPNIGEPIAFTVCNCENKGYYNGLFLRRWTIAAACGYIRDIAYKIGDT